MADLRVLKLALLAETKDFVKGLDSATAESKTFSEKLGGALKKGALAFAALGAAAGAVAIKIGKDAIAAASDFAETLSKSGEIFGDVSKDIEAFASTAAKRLGQTRQEALDAAATFGIFGKSAGLSGKDLGEFSTDFVTLASDLASFNNTSPEEAINAIGAALRGEAEPIRKYGILLNDATLKQKALELGIISNTKNALTPQQKILAAQAAIYEQSATAQGDFERTSGGLANQQRILKATIEDLKIELGTALLPIALEVFKFFSDTALPIIKSVVDAVKNWVKVLDFDLKGSLKNTQTIFQPVLDGLRKAFGFVTDAVDRNREKLKPLFDLLKALGQFIATFLAPIVLKGLGLLFEVIGQTIGTVIDIIAFFIDIIKKASDAVIAFITPIQNAINKIIELINLIPKINVNLPTVNIVGGKNAPTVVNNVNVKGAVDPQSTARTIVKTLNTAQKTTGVLIPGR
jgi:hypothetical protein